MKKLDFANISSEEITSGDYDGEEVQSWQIFHEAQERENAKNEKAKIEAERNDPFRALVKKYTNKGAL